MTTLNQPRGQEAGISGQGDGLSRRTLLKAPLALGIASVTTGAGFVIAPEARAGRTDQATIDPRYFPLRRLVPEIGLEGKLAVITGASRGNGRAIGEALAALGVDVIGTSRNPDTVPNPPAFPLLKLDIADTDSVLTFPARLGARVEFQRRGFVDILCNNAGRLVVGQIAPLPPTDPAFYLSQRDLAIRTLYFGHVMVTNVMLPLMRHVGYSRIIFTASIASYYTGFAQPGGSLLDAYNSGKAALRGFANALAGGFRDAGSSIRVSTVNPYAMKTALAVHPHPIYTQPVGSDGLSATDQVFNAVLTAFRQALANGQPTGRIGDTYCQLLRMADPLYNVVVASPVEPFATEGSTAYINQVLLAENEVSAAPFK
jgi:NAD(P)-dependent dehydrogenase (short-subunit alcohol dehydrogenase family)